MGGTQVKTQRARKKPVEITFQIFDPEKHQWPDGCEPLSDDNYSTDVADCAQCGKPLTEQWHGWTPTLEGGHIACPGDIIITGVDFEKYPCKPGIFAKTYEVLED